MLVGAKRVVEGLRRGGLGILLRKLFSGENFILALLINPDKLRSIHLNRLLKKWGYLRNHWMIICFRSDLATGMGSILINTIMRR